MVPESPRVVFEICQQIHEQLALVLVGSGRALWPFEVVWEKRTPTRILKDGADLPPDKAITVAFNSYDSQSAGRRLMRMREIVYLPSSNRRAIDINTRDALIEHLLNM